jgi:hypothetical protein
MRPESLPGTAEAAQRGAIHAEEAAVSTDLFFGNEAQQTLTIVQRSMPEGRANRAISAGPS